MESFSSTSSAVREDAADDAPERRQSFAFSVRVRVVNRAQLAAAYGEDAAVTVLAAIVGRALAVVKGRGGVVQRDEGVSIVIDPPTSLLQAPGTDENAVAGALEQAFVALGTEPIVHDGEHLFASLAVAGCPISAAKAGSGNCALEETQRSLDSALLDRGPHLPPPHSGSRWVAGYVADMRRVALAHQAMAEDRVVLMWQPIFGGEDGRRILYSEGLARIVDPHRHFGAGDIVTPDAFVPALERLGMVRAFDAHVMRLAIERLASDPSSRLGCNISAQSAVVDSWWADILATLDAAPKLAARLTIEITETARFPSLGNAIEFRRAMARLLCRIAIDDFGRGHMAVSDVAALEPDIVKIDAWFLRRACRADGLDALRHLVGLAEALALGVVIEGVASREAERQAASAGARWMQGNFLALPAMMLLNDAGGVAEPDLRDDLAPELDTPVFRIPPSHWLANFAFAAGLWCVIGLGAWAVVGR